MPRLLIVDDEPGYRRQLEITLREGLDEVRTADSGRAGIQVGTRFRPDVLIADWMLKDDIHGVHVAQALRAVLPNLRIIMITGFPSDDLRADAERVGIVDFLEKPFQTDRLRSALRTALATGPTPRGAALLSMFEVDADGRVVYANPPAEDLLTSLALTPAGADVGALLGSEVRFDDAVSRWQRVTLAQHPETTWHVRTQPADDDGHRLVVVRPDAARLQLSNPLIEMLLGLHMQDPRRWPLEGRILLIDDETLVRNVVASLLERVGVGCYAVATVEQGHRLLQNDEGIRYVVHDYEIANAPPDDSIEHIRRIRPDVTLIGTSGSDHRDDFLTLGVRHYLQKPWRVHDLVNVVTGRIAHCLECGLPLPLRRPKPDEEGQSWACRYCGARYHALVDAGFPEDVLQNVQPVGD